MFAPPSKSCRFSHPPSPRARSMAQGISLSADSDSGGSSPPENLPPAALSWISLFGATILKSFRFRTMLCAVCFCRDTASRVRQFQQGKIPLKTFRRNVSKIVAQQAGRRAERSCSLRPRKAAAFLTHLLRAPEAWRREFRCLRTATQEAPRLLRTSRQLRSAGAAFSGQRF